MDFYEGFEKDFRVPDPLFLTASIMTTRKRQLPSFAAAVCSSNHRQAAKVHTSDEALDDRTETIARLRSAFVPPCVPSVLSCSRAPFCDAGFGRFCGPPSPASCYIRSKLGRVHSARNKRSATSKATMSLESGAPPMVARATSAPSAKTIRRLRSYSCGEFYPAALFPSPAVRALSKSGEHGKCAVFPDETIVE